MPKQSSSMRSLTIIHMVMLIGQIVFAVIVLAMINSRYWQPAHQDMDSIFQVVAIALAAAGFFLGTRKFKKALQQIREDNGTAVQKFEKYRAASILLWAMIEGPAIFCIVCFLLTGNYAFIALAGVLIFLFFIFGPNRQKLSMFLGLSEEEINNLP